MLFHRRRNIRWQLSGAAALYIACESISALRVGDRDGSDAVAEADHDADLAEDFAIYDVDSERSDPMKPVLCSGRKDMCACGGNILGIALGGEPPAQINLTLYKQDKSNPEVTSVKQDDSELGAVCDVPGKITRMLKNDLHYFCYCQAPSDETKLKNAQKQAESMKCEMLPYPITHWIPKCTCAVDEVAVVSQVGDSPGGKKADVVKPHLHHVKGKWNGNCQPVVCKAKALQKDKKGKLQGYDYLLLEGGGVKGAAYGGALDKLKELGLLANVKGFAGASAGSLTATVLAAGFSPEEFKKSVQDMDWDDMTKGSDKNLKSVAEIKEEFAHKCGAGGFAKVWHLKGCIDLLLHIVGVVSRKFGYYSSHKIQEQCQKYLQQKGFNKGNVTFKEFYELLKNKGSAKELRFPAVSMNAGEMKWFSRQSTPDVEVCLAARASSSIPFFFRPTLIKMTPESPPEMFVDGGMLRNLPHDAFDLTEHTALGLILHKHRSLEYIDAFSAVKMGQFIGRIVETLWSGPDSPNQLDFVHDNLDIVALDADLSLHAGVSVDGLDFDLTETQVRLMTEEGSRAVREMFERCLDEKAKTSEKDAKRLKDLEDKVKEENKERVKQETAKWKNWKPEEFYKNKSASLLG